MRNKCLLGLGLVFVISLTSMVAFAFSFTGTPADEVDETEIIVSAVVSEEAYAMPTTEPITTTGQEMVKNEQSKIGSMDWDSDDAYKLAKIAMAEAESEDTEGKALVMLVVLNRVWDDEFPDTIEEVIFQKGQFSPISNGRYDEVEPDEDCYRAYTKKKAELEDMQEKAVAYQKAKTEYSAAVFHESETRSSFDREKQKADEQKQVLEKKVAILNESGCVDIEKAHCKFLQDAIEAKEQLAVHEALYVDIAARRDCELEKSRQAIADKQAEMDAIGYDAAALTVLQNECATLLPYVAQLEKINQRENNLALIKAALEHLKSNISEAENRLAEVKLKGTQAETERDIYAKAFEEHVHVLSAITALDPWVEKEKMLPVAEERNATALNRVLELTAEITGIDDEISERQAEADKEILAMAGMEEAQAIVNGLDTEVNAINSMVKEKQMRIGALQQKSEQIAKLKQDIAALQDKQVEYAKETADYDTLKVAFSQSGVPHQIIRSIIPQLTATANTILGQMTGGKMGVEFRLEKLQKNGKEKVSLDIYIEEYGKSVLPYLSKSGGEKVKSSLSVILALAEIKSSSAGIQLGMLFIDEPPFLDGDGIQAYCDALETIQSRYSNIKIMAITHDPTMKARFPQNLDVVKTENGSKVIY